MTAVTHDDTMDMMTHDDTMEWGMHGHDGDDSRRKMSRSARGDDTRATVRLYALCGTNRKLLHLPCLITQASDGRAWGRDMMVYP